MLSVDSLQPSASLEVLGSGQCCVCALVKQKQDECLLCHYTVAATAVSRARGCNSVVFNLDFKWEKNSFGKILQKAAQSCESVAGRHQVRTGYCCRRLCCNWSDTLLKWIRLSKLSRIVSMSWFASCGLFPSLLWCVNKTVPDH